LKEEEAKKLGILYRALNEGIKWGIKWGIK
jgi:hypothetical protein